MAVAGLLKYELKRYETVCRVDEFAAACVDIPKFLSFCRECPNYGHNWMCPPFDFDASEIWKNFAGLRLFARQLVFVQPADVPAGADPLVPAVA